MASLLPPLECPLLCQCLLTKFFTHFRWKMFNFPKELVRKNFAHFGALSAVSLPAHVLRWEIPSPMSQTKKMKLSEGKLVASNYALRCGKKWKNACVAYKHQVQLQMVYTYVSAVYVYFLQPASCRYMTASCEDFGYKKSRFLFRMSICTFSIFSLSNLCKTLNRR